MIKKIFSLTFLFLILLTLPLNTQAQKKRPPVKKPLIITSVTVKAEPEPQIDTKNLTERQKIRLESFRVVWQTINDYYFDPKFNGLDWRKLKYANELKVVKAETDEQFYKILEDLIAPLNASHFEIIPPEFIEEIENIRANAAQNDEKESEEDKENAETPTEDKIAEILKSLEEYNSLYGIGAEIKFFGSDLIITRIDKNSAAEKSGLKLGYKIEKINGISIADLLARFRAIENYEKNIEYEVPVYLKTFLLNGEKDSPVSIVYHDGRNPSRDVQINRERLEGELIDMDDNLPRQFLEFETGDVNNETGYIRFNMFTVSSAEKFCQAITNFKNKKSLIIDLRGNVGGLIGAIYGIGGLLIEKNQTLGTEVTRRGEERLAINPHLKKFKGEIVVLADRSSISAAEILTSFLQESGRATVIGETTAGKALPSLSRVLPNGAVFQYPISNFKSAKGKSIEGAGVKPDIEIALDRAKLLAGTDNQIDEAVKFLQKKSSESTANAARKTETPKPPPPAPVGNSRSAVKTEIKEEYDAQAISVIEKYVKSIGGAEALKNLKSIRADGTATINKSGATIEGDVEFLRKFPNKIAETFTFPAIGDVVEIFDGEKYLVQMQVTGAQQFDSPVRNAELKLEQDFLEFVNLKENYRQIKFLGKFDRSGKQVNLIQAKNAAGNGFVLAFDAATNFLVHRSGNATEISYDDYRKVGEYTFPFKLQKEMTVEIEFYEMETNVEIGDERFSQKLSCFDRVD